MPKREFLGGFELLVLLALIKLGDEAYGVPISEAIEDSSGKEVAMGSVYITLERLERKGFVTSTLGEPDSRTRRTCQDLLPDHPEGPARGAPGAADADDALAGRGAASGRSRDERQRNHHGSPRAC